MGIADKLDGHWVPCRKRPVEVYVRAQREGETHVSTREGITPLKPDDLIIRGVEGEEYPIGREIFEKTYDLLHGRRPNEYHGDEEDERDECLEDIDDHPVSRRFAERLVLFTPTSVYLLYDVRRDANGTFRSGTVINGAWHLEVRGDEWCCLDGNGHVVTRLEAPERVIEVKVKPSWHGDYNEIIGKAEQELAKMEAANG